MPSTTLSHLLARIYPCTLIHCPRVSLILLRHIPPLTVQTGTLRKSTSKHLCLLCPLVCYISLNGSIYIRHVALHRRLFQEFIHLCKMPLPFLPQLRRLWLGRPFLVSLAQGAAFALQILQDKSSAGLPSSLTMPTSLLALTLRARWT